MINANTPFADATREGTSRLTPGFKYVTEYTFGNETKGDVNMFLRWDGPEFSVRDRDGNFTARNAWIKNVATGKVSKRRFGLHGSVKIA